jgi:hypothetical protein
MPGQRVLLPLWLTQSIQSNICPHTSSFYLSHPPETVECFLEFGAFGIHAKGCHVVFYKVAVCRASMSWTPIETHLEVPGCLVCLLGRSVLRNTKNCQLCHTSCSQTMPNFCLKQTQWCSSMLPCLQVCHSEQEMHSRT